MPSLLNSGINKNSCKDKIRVNVKACPIVWCQTRKCLKLVRTFSDMLSRFKLQQGEAKIIVILVIKFFIELCE